jgi:GTP:adenosylcobinamide-phosphate guanylyltransferase
MTTGGNKMSESLYELSSKFAYHFELYQDDEDNEALLEALGTCGEEYSEKLENCVKYFKNLTSKADMFLEESKRLKAIADKYDRKAESLKNYINDCVNDSDGTSKWNRGIHSINYRKSQTVEIDNLLDIPDVYLRTKTIVEPDKIAIKEVLKQGGDITGARLETNFNIQIK